MPDSIFQKYKKKTITELRPFDPIDGTAVAEGRIGVSSEARAAGSPKPGDYVARDPTNTADQWLVTAEYFAANFEPIA